MSIYEALIAGNEKYGTPGDEICKSVLNCDKEYIKETVIIAPCWEPQLFQRSFMN